MHTPPHHHKGKTY